MQARKTQSGIGVWWLGLLLIVACSLSQAAPALQTGLNGTWWNADQDGQGFVIHIIPDANQLFLAWFTFAPSGGKQLWLTGSGTLDQMPVELTLTLTSGGALNSPEPATSAQQWGSATLQFDTCATGNFSFDGQATGSIDITRLTPVVSCDEGSQR
ncbi:MAG: hypothetical protein AB8B96_00255 [Lysobacterales bacterium]